jgi:hypothetical protein
MIQHTKMMRFSPLLPMKRSTGESQWAPTMGNRIVHAVFSTARGASSHDKPPGNLHVCFKSVDLLGAGKIAKWFLRSRYSFYDK